MQSLTTQAFETAYQSLNPEQQKAVNQIDGPVLVFAGPGTGKTKVLSVRIGHILQQIDVGRGAILCLTFTNAGVQSMKKNLIKLLGAEAEKIEVHTYHSFASKLIKRDTTDNYTSKHTVLNNAQRFMILERLLSDPNIASSYLTEKPKTASVLSSLAEIFSDFKKQDINNLELNHIIDIEVDKIKNNPDNTSSRGELKKDILKIINQLEKFRDLGRLYDAYVAEMERKNKYEYEDLLDIALCKLMENPGLLATLQETYQYILVDEFQDTNKKQLQMLELLISGIEKPNLFVVGDDDQCIFKFQGAGNENLERLLELIPDIRTISLRTNYRSTPDIINISHALISKNAGRPQQKQDPLNAATNTTEVSTEIHRFENETDEGYYIATRINEAITNGERPESIAVLFRKRSYAKDLKSWLDYFEIPYSWNSGKGNVLDEYWGKMFYFAIRYIQLTQIGAKEAESYLLNLCMKKFGNELIAIHYTRYRFEKTDKESFLNWLERTAAAPEIESWIKEAVAVKMEDRLDTEQLTSLELWLGLSELRNEKNQTTMIDAWDAFVKEYIDTNSYGTWQVFARLLNYYQHYRLSIEFEESSPAKGVTLSTIHGSKGLEYHQVFVMGCSNNQWENARHASNKIVIPKPMNQHLNKSADEIEDLRRLKYVAFTRAEHKLTLSYVQNGKREINSMLNELMPMLNDATTVHPKMDNDSMLLETKQVKLSPDLEKAWNQALEKFELTASALNAYIKDPEKFIWHSFFKIQDLPGEAMSFGTAIHRTLEYLTKAHKGNPISEELIIEEWNKSIQTYSYLFDPLHYKQYKKYGLKFLFEYFNTVPRNNGTVEYITEAFLQGTIGSVKISGKIDLIKISGNSISVIDYKTGTEEKYIKSFQSFTSPGDRFWRQAAIYAELIKQNYPDKQLDKVEFHFIETGIVVAAKVNEVNDDWKSYIEIIYNHIANRRILKYVETNYYDIK